MGIQKYEFKKLNTVLVYQIDILKSTIKIFFSVRFGQFFRNLNLYFVTIN